jgi:hypothetical protein
MLEKKLVLQPRLTTALLPQYTHMRPPAHRASLSASAHSSSEGMKDCMVKAINTVKRGKENKRHHRDKSEGKLSREE